MFSSFFDKRKHQWWAQVFKMKPQQQHQQSASRQRELKQFQPINRQYQSQFQFQPNFQRQLFQFQPYQPSQSKNVNWQNRNGQFYRLFGYHNNAYNSNLQNRQSNANAQPRQFTQSLKYPNSDVKNLPERRQGYATSYDSKGQLQKRRSFKIYDGNQQSRQPLSFTQLPSNFGNRQRSV